MSNVKSMENLDKAERMLRQCPRGIRAADFMRKMGFSSRQTAYNYLNSLELKGKAYNEHGLWFPKEVDISVEKAPQKQAEKRDSSLEKETFLYRCFKKLDYITSINNHGSSFEAYRDLRSLIWTLPSTIKDTLRPDIQKADEALQKYKDEIVNGVLVKKTKKRKAITFYYVEKLVDEVSSLLHKQLEGN